MLVVGRVRVAASIVVAFDRRRAPPPTPAASVFSRRADGLKSGEVVARAEFRFFWFEVVFHIAVEKIVFAAVRNTRGNQIGDARKRFRNVICIAKAKGF